MYSNEDYEPYATRRDGHVEALLRRSGIPLKLFKDQVIFAKNEVLGKSGQPQKIFGSYRKSWLEKLTDADLQAQPSADLFRAENLARVPAPPRPTLEGMGFVRYEQFVPTID